MPNQKLVSSGGIYKGKTSMWLYIFHRVTGVALFGYLIDIGFTVGDIAVVSGIYIFISLILLFLVRKKLNPVII